VAIGSIQDGKGGRKPTAVVTSDGGAHWDVVKLEEAPVSLFFLNDSLGWMVTEKGIWKTDEAGKDWKKLPKPPALPMRVYFADENHGWAACNKKTVLVTHDGGHKWEPIKAASDPPGSAGALRLLLDQLRQPELWHHLRIQSAGDALLTEKHIGSIVKKVPRGLRNSKPAET
jgi:photosystem II stability/assembly factor-like uncharacterized protein